MSDQPATSMRSFVIVWLGQLVSITGTTLTAFGLQFFIYTETGSVTRVALIALSYALPAVILAPIAGSIVDRSDRRTVMLLSDVAAGAATAGLLWALGFGSIPFWFICHATAVGSSANAFQDPAWLASIPVLVPRTQLGRANGMVQLNQGVAIVVAPVLAGALLAAGGLRAVLIVDLVALRDRQGPLGARRHAYGRAVRCLQGEVPVVVQAVVVDVLQIRHQSVEAQDVGGHRPDLLRSRQRRHHHLGPGRDLSH